PGLGLGSRLPANTECRLVERRPEKLHAYRRAAMRDGVGEHHALARDFAPFDVAVKMLTRRGKCLASGLAVLDDEFLPAGPLPVRFGETEVFNRALDAERVVECF